MKVAFITGGARGIGQAIVERFVSEGWGVVSCSLHEGEGEKNSNRLDLKCDISKVEEVKAAIQTTLRRFGRLDAIINNAGMSGSNPLGQGTPDDLWHEIVDVNLHGPYYVCKYGAPHLPDRTGRIVNLGSILSLKGVPDQTAYCAAKHGVLGFTRSYAHFLSPRGITVNAVCPGWVDTEMAAQRMKEIGIPKEQLLAAVPLGRMAYPEEVADLVYFLCASKASAMMTGQAISIDGGVLA